MNKLIYMFLLVTFISCNASKNIASAPGDIVIHSVNIIPMNEEKVVANQTVLIRNGRIESIVSSSINHSKDATVIDGSGKYLMPGLAEMHAHVPPNDNMDAMKEVLLLFAANGVTTIRGMLGHPKHLELRSLINSGEVLGPRFITSGPSFSGNSVKSAEQGAEMVRQQKAAGYDFLKIHPGISKENFAVIAQTAKEVNIPIAGHVPYDVGVWRAIDAGFATIEHLDGFVESLVPGIENITEQENGFFGSGVGTRADTTKIPQLMNALRLKNIWVVPTQALAERWMSPIEASVFQNAPEMIYMSPNTRTQWLNSKNNFMNSAGYNTDNMNHFLQLRRKLIYELQRKGVGLLLGADAPQVYNVPGFSAHHELRYLVDAGLTPFEALQTGTTNVGRFLNRTDLGVVVQGAVADLVLLNHNPLENINNTTSIEGVILNGKWLSKQWITDTLKSLEK
ncbi:MAG: amidohydrolase family protein [Flavisolibacter sp.]|nr:amidohydrolase family protein [Flavisolibacter sp.]